FMKRALQLAAKARGRTSPNPMVGAVIVKNGKIIAEDYHKKPGELHAEALAILKAQNSGLKTQNSILYVTLEPCCHTDKRTPPCTKAIIDAGIKKVFVAMKDPNHRVSGKGIEELKSYGIKVTDGLLEESARRLNETYIKYITTKTPFVILKTAMTLDGKIATPDRQSKWITGEKARKVVHQMRSSVDAVMTAIGTVKTDNPELTARIKGGRSPKRIVIDPNLETPLDYKVFNVPPETIVVTKKSEEKKKVLIERGIKIIEYEGERVNLKWLMQELGNIGITSLMIEAGSSFNASALNDGIVDKVVFFIAPKIIGGKDSITPVGGNTFQRLQDAYRIRDLKMRRVGEDYDRGISE
ncbi:MAG: bifunctional diaminohydroxyphosphoribosylaminopyrimidine deaminase/5-amino-6-(5-phosphoribosylamino)uracil reductase RibD, partial [Thermodesulfovibrio sp.]|nr:bifunctional diaminohydroxyphosphoribosylaminopyrimidine deaminase/5-amino-6-(5-phosphoribosylamino)uracil reductase RibD [Thermodesulfovibrio sp.]